MVKLIRLWLNCLFFSFFFDRRRFRLFYWLLAIVRKVTGVYPPNTSLNTMWRSYFEINLKWNPLRQEASWVRSLPMQHARGEHVSRVRSATKTQDGTMTKKCRARLCIPGLARHFFVILPSWLFRSSCCVTASNMARQEDVKGSFIFVKKSVECWS